MPVETAAQNANAQKRAVDHLRNLLRREFRPDDRLPTLKQMAGRFDVGVSAVRQAVLRLEMQGYLKSKQGSGIYVTDQSKRLQVRRIGIYGRLKGHLWEEVSRELVNVFGSDPTMVASWISFDSNMSPQETKKTLARRIETDELDVLLVVGLGIYKEHRNAIESLKDQVNVIDIYDRPYGEVASGHGYVTSDLEAGYAQAIRHLKQIDCREILVLSHGWAERMEKHCRQVAGKTRIHFLCDSPSIAGYPQRVCDYLQANPAIDGVFGFGDWRVASILPALRPLGKRIPDDLALIGYGDTPWGSIINVPLSTVNTRPQELAKVVYDMVQRGCYQEQYVIEPRLVVRTSSSR